MNNKASILVIVLLLAGAAAIAIIKTKNGEEARSDGADAGKAVRAVQPGAGAGGAGTDAGAKVTDRSAREIRDAELVDKYGSTRTKLSRQVSENVVSLLDDTVAMGEMLSNRGAEFGGGGRMMRGMVQRRTGVELTEDQQAKAMEIYTEFQERELEKFKGTVETLRQDPSALMELLLAGDAKARDEMTEEEYAAAQAAAGEKLGEVLNPLDQTNFRPRNPMEDEAFRAAFEAMLDDEQTETMRATMAAGETDGEEGGNADPAGADAVSERNITNIPAMELEKMDEAVGAAKKMTSGIRQVMEGVGGLNDLRSQMEQPPGGAEE